LFVEERALELVLAQVVPGSAGGGEVATVDATGSLV
jgi:hypothetical protein